MLNFDQAFPVLTTQTEMLYRKWYFYIKIMNKKFQRSRFYILLSRHSHQRLRNRWICHPISIPTRLFVREFVITIEDISNVTVSIRISGTILIDRPRTFKHEHPVH